MELQHLQHPSAQKYTRSCVNKLLFFTPPTFYFNYFLDPSRCCHLLNLLNSVLKGREQPVLPTSFTSKRFIEPSSAATTPCCPPFILNAPNPKFPAFPGWFPCRDSSDPSSHICIIVLTAFLGSSSSKGCCSKVGQGLCSSLQTTLGLSLQSRTLKNTSPGQAK